MNFQTLGGGPLGGFTADPNRRYAIGEMQASPAGVPGTTAARLIRASGYLASGPAILRREIWVEVVEPRDIWEEQR